MAYNPSILQEVLQARSLSHAALSQRLGLSPKDLERELGREPEPRQSILNEIAKELALPPFVFFMRAPPQLNDAIPDFRSAKPSPTSKAKATTEAIQLAAAIQDAARQLDVPGVSELPQIASPEQIHEFALRAREFFGISLRDQAESKEARTFYNLCRKKIEDQGVFVVQESFPETDGSGFCLADRLYPVIVVNTKKQTRGRRLFTLIHELAHVLIGATGISDPFIQKNQTEKFCNLFASFFLVPNPYVLPLLQNISPPRDPDIDDVASIARRLKISQQAAILRLEQLRLVREGSHERWLNAIHNIGNPDYSERGGGAGGPPPQEKVKLAKYGFHFANAFDTPLRQGLVSEINLYRATGLKPKYQRAYFDFANSINNTELRDLEIDSE